MNTPWHDETEFIEALHHSFEYDEEDGELRWLYGKRKGYPAGSITDWGYIRIELLGSTFLAHRAVWAIHHGYWPQHQIDHIDRNPANNLIDNLRPADNTLQRLNTDAYGICGVKGVTFREGRSQPYTLKIKQFGKVIVSKSFATLQEASDASDAAYKAILEDEHERSKSLT